MFRYLAIGLAMSVALAGTAKANGADLAPELSGFYIGGGAAAADRRDGHVRGFMQGPGAFSATGNANAESQTGYNVNVLAGYEYPVMNSLTVFGEVEGWYQDIELRRLSPVNAAFFGGPSVTFLPSFDLNGSTSSYGVIGSIGVAWRNDSPFTPYLKAGAGGSWDTLKIKSLGGFTINGEDDDSGYVAKIGAGVEYEITKSIGLTFDFGYKRSLEDRRFNIPVAVGSTSATVSVDVPEETLTYGLGLRWRI